MEALPRALRTPALALSATAALAAALVFTQGLVFPSRTLSPSEVQSWRGFAEQLPGARIEEALDALVPAAPAQQPTCHPLDRDAPC